MSAAAWRFFSRNRLWYRQGGGKPVPIWAQGQPVRAREAIFLFIHSLPYALDFPTEFADQMLSPDSFPIERRPHRRIAVAPAQRLLAHIEPGTRLATVRDRNGRIVAKLPTGEIHGFTPDGRQIVVSDRLGGLRFWDFAGDTGGRITRTLRSLPPRESVMLQKVLPSDNSGPGTFRVAAIQAASAFGRPEENRKMLADLVRRAAHAGAEVVVLPEAAITGYLDYALTQTWQVGAREVSKGLAGVPPDDAAETVPGTSTRFFSELAGSLGIYLSATLVEVDRLTGMHYNTITLFGPDGSTLIHYRKLNPWKWAERGWATDGDLGRPVADTVFGRFGVLVCFDIHEQAAEMGRLKIDTLLYSIAWVEDERSEWFARELPRRALTHGYNIVAANWTLPAGEYHPVAGVDRALQSKRTCSHRRLNGERRYCPRVTAIRRTSLGEVTGDRQTVNEPFSQYPNGLY